MILSSDNDPFISEQQQPAAASSIPLSDQSVLFYTLAVS